ncbi:MAG: hypothetical protein J0I48_03790 [Devosia sp.]|uniref:hypothetical protein n=1 Tax=unclassified Devosia TaxID=196773 RepID=UPI00092C8070|nr:MULTISPECIES: hypothetical protein [unclassified Devosia]MBL8596516.1 hypothetical protein [Devosia sp.]MBN9345313.1 hypothetical protein [Devosia sp.]OJX51310.1 MAG: hypothetical protein BGO81_11550 [Devosia sp. 66-22]
MTFRYSITLPATGSHKLPRFARWSRETAPDIVYSLPPQVPIEAETLTVRLRSVADRDRLRSLFPAALP